MIKPAYYVAQESAYKLIREKGEAGWLRKSFDEFRDVETDSLITKYVTSHFKETKGLMALDLGTGSGSTAHTLYDLGFNVIGIDVCPSAIEHAKEIAQDMNKDISFEVKDVLSLNKKFDVIYDSHCYHCVVLTEDRYTFLKSVHDSLTSDGIFILDTMAFNETDDSWKEFETLKFDENYILWHKTNGETHGGVVKSDDTYWCPQRRVYTAERILEEVRNHGFKIISYSLDTQGEKKPFMLRAVCRLV
jgi:2-polyprenyl-3-methyl-5-hydroxy-6-metoxy-1,4-benzoquinol methylase